MTTVLALFLGSFPLPDGASNPGRVDHVLCVSFLDLVGGPTKGPARKLFAAWLDRRRGPMALGAGLDAALYGGVPEAVPAARRSARSSRTISIPRWKRRWRASA